ncbi:class I SAM-dependent methyltransferase [Gammaproteobacteria bacterium]|nr:class I SAM-dependent methyltransferase [Gammaproteobacteria bacterium]
MVDQVQTHYGGGGDLADSIARNLQAAGKNLEVLKTSDLSTVDEFHIRGRKATLELGGHMKLGEDSYILDMGSGLGGPARTLAEEYGCHVTGIDLTQAFCDAARQLSKWVNLDNGVMFQQGDATSLPFEDNRFDAAMTIHVAMNIPAKDKMYAEAKRVIKSGGVFAVYDVLKGEGGDVLFPVPWAREPSISHLVTRDEMEALLTQAGLEILQINDSTEESHGWFEAMAARMVESGPPPVTFQTFMGDDFPEMVRNQDRNLSDRRIRTISFICKA